MGTLTIRPTGVGNTTELTAFGDSPNHNCVDDVTPDDDTTRVYPVSLPNTYYDTYQMANHTTETDAITNVRVYVRAKKVATGGGASDATRTVIRSGGTDYYGSSETLTGDTYIDYYTDYAQNPADTNDWEWADIDALEAGVELYGHGTVSPRCTQVYVVVTYETASTSDRNISVDIDISGDSDRNLSVDILALSMSDRNVEVAVEAQSKSDRNVSVDISANVLELCYYDTSNSRWTDGSYGGELVRVIDNVTKLTKKEELNKLSTLSFEIFSYDENWGIEEGAIIALGLDFTWSGTPGASSSEILSGFLFQGQITKVEKKTPNPEGLYDLKVEAVHSINTLHEQYVNYLISIIRVYQGGGEKLCTSAYHIKELLDDVVYYDETGSATDVPAFVRRDNEYIHHREYIDKNKLEVFLDICKNSQNVFYCHNEEFYFEPKKPVLSATYYQAPYWQQNYNSMSYDSTFKALTAASLTQNAWDITGSGWVFDNMLYGYFMNTSPYSQNLPGITFWSGLEKDTPTGALYLYSLTDLRTINSTLESSESWSPHSTTAIDICRNDNDWDRTVTSGTPYMVGFFVYQYSNDEIEFGTHYPSRIFYPSSYRAHDGVSTTYNIFRTNFTIPIQAVISDQIRWFEPSIPPRFIVYEDGTQLDEWYNEGWNPELGEYCLSGYMQDTSIWGWCDWTTYPHHFLLLRDYNVISDLTGVTNENAGIDEDENLRLWYQDTKEFEVEFELTCSLKDAIYSGIPNYLSVCMAFDWDGHGLKDYIRGHIYDSAGGEWVALQRVSDGTPTTIGTMNYGLAVEDYIYKMRFCFKFEDDSTWMRVRGYDTNQELWLSSPWYDMGVPARTGEGVGLQIEKMYDYGIKYLTMREVYGREAELDDDLIIKKERKDKGQASQYVVIGEKSPTGTRVPFAKYPETPDASGPVIVKRLNVYSDDAAKSAAQYLYEADNGENISIEIYDLFGVEPNQSLKPNKQIKVDDDYYYIDKIQFDITQEVQKLKISGGSAEVGFYAYLAKLEDEKDEKKEQDVANAPLYYRFIMDDDMGADEMQDNTPDVKGDLPSLSGAHRFTR